MESSFKVRNFLVFLFVFGLNFILYSAESGASAAEVSSAKRVHSEDDAEQKFRAFTERYYAPKDIADALDKKMPIQFDNLVKLPQGKFYLKYDNPFQRMVNGLRVQKFLDKNNFQYIKIPQLYLYCYQGTWYLLSQAIEENDEFNKISEEEKKTLHAEFIQFLVATGYSDFYGMNTIRSGKSLFFIDLENSSFTVDGRDYKAILTHFKSEFLEYNQSKETTVYIDDLIKDFKMQEESSRAKILPKNDALDPEGVDGAFIKEYAQTLAKKR